MITGADAEQSSEVTEVDRAARGARNVEPGVRVAEMGTAYPRAGNGHEQPVQQPKCLGRLSDCA